MIMTTVLSLSVNLFCFVGFSLSLVTSLVFGLIPSFSNGCLG